MSNFAIKKYGQDVLIGFKQKKHLDVVWNSFSNTGYLPFSMSVADETQYEPEREPEQMPSFYPGLNCFGFIKMSKKRSERYGEDYIRAHMRN